MLAQMITRSLRLASARKGKQVTHILPVGAQHRSEIFREPVISPAGENEMIDIGLAVCASENNGGRRAMRHNLESVSDIGTFGCVSHDAVRVQAVYAFPDWLIIGR